MRLLSSQNESAQSGSDSSGSAAIGLSAGLGEQGAGLSLTLAASRALGSSNGSTTTQQASTVAAGKTLSIESGGDTDILGGTASGETLKAQMGGDLNLASRCVHPQEPAPHDRHCTAPFSLLPGHPAPAGVHAARRHPCPARAGGAPT